MQNNSDHLAGGAGGGVQGPARRRFIDAPSEDRCAWTIKLKDGSEAQCGRRKTDGDLCTQHSKMAERPFCSYCGGNDELPPDHCADCERPNAKAKAQGGAA